MSAFDKLADVIRWAAEECVPHADKAHHVAVEVRERFVVIDREKIQHQVDTVLEYVGAVSGKPSIKSGPAHAQVHAGADHARDMAVHYLALAQWIDEHPPAPPVDEKAVRELAAAIDSAFVPEANKALFTAASRDEAARRLVADGWKREVTP